ncbi:hypothetical protein C8R43DRAFT_929018 [Mycena crocata]|nr:hypothetical protein C8R43DRAFT_929018 [Mycena crocata]
MALAGSVLAQGFYIGAPADETTVKAGHNFTVEVIEPNGLHPYWPTDLSVLIGFINCDPCPTPFQSIGTVLHYGSLKTDYHDGVSASGPQQNFTVTIPKKHKGRGQLTVVRYAIIGPFEERTPYLSDMSISLVVK